MQRLDVSGAVRPIYGSLGVKRLSCFKFHKALHIVHHHASYLQVPFFNVCCYVLQSSAYINEYRPSCGFFAVSHNLAYMSIFG